MIVVFDSSAFIFLSKLGIIESGLSLFSKSFIPYFVKEEISGRNDEASLALEKLQKNGSIEIISAKNNHFVNALRRSLGKGESETIVVGLDINADFVILDDHAARSMAVRLGINVKGTLGIIKRLMELHEFNSDLNLLYDKLSNMGFRVKESLFYEIFN